MLSNPSPAPTCEIRAVLQFLNQATTPEIRQLMADTFTERGGVGLEPWGHGSKTDWLDNVRRILEENRA